MAQNKFGNNIFVAIRFVCKFREKFTQNLNKFEEEINVDEKIFMGLGQYLFLCLFVNFRKSEKLITVVGNSGALKLVNTNFI